MISEIDCSYRSRDEWIARLLTTDILKAYLADKLRLLLTARSMQIMNVVLGALLIFFGAQLLYHAKTIALH